jgi:hypothetical protein
MSASNGGTTTGTPPRGTLFERIVAYLGIGFLVVGTLGMFATALDPRFDVEGFPPLWIGGFFTLVAAVAGVRQIAAWRRGARAHGLLDPVRARMGRRAVPTVAWFFAGCLGVMLFYVVSGVGRSEGPFTGINQVFFFGSFFLGAGLEVVLSRRTDRREGMTGLGPFDPAEQMVAATTIPEPQRKVTSVLFVFTLASLVVGLVLGLLDVIPPMLLLVSLVPLVIWQIYVNVVVRSRMRQLHSESEDATPPRD